MALSWYLVADTWHLDRLIVIIAYHSSLRSSPKLPKHLFFIKSRWLLLICFIFFIISKFRAKVIKNIQITKIKSEFYRARLNLMFIIHTCDVFNRLNAILLHAPCNFPHALKGQKLLAQGIRPGYSCPHAWRPVGAKALYGDPNMIQYSVKLTFNRL